MSLTAVHQWRDPQDIFHILCWDGISGCVRLEALCRMISVWHQSTVRAIREQTDSSAFESLSRYFDVIHWSLSAASSWTRLLSYPYTGVTCVMWEMRSSTGVTLESCVIWHASNHKHIKHLQQLIRLLKIKLHQLSNSFIFLSMNVQTYGMEIKLSGNVSLQLIMF